MKKFEWQHSDETLLYYTRENLMSFLIGHLKDFCFVMALILVFLLIWVSTFWKEQIFVYVWAFIIFLPFFWYYSKKYKDWEFYVTNKRVIKYMRSGIFSKHEKIYDINDIKQVRWDTIGLWSIIFKYGTINMDAFLSANLWEKTDTPGTYFRGIKNYKDVVMYFSRVIDFIQKNPETKEITPYIPKKLRKNNS